MSFFFSSPYRVYLLPFYSCTSYLALGFAAFFLFSLFFFFLFRPSSFLCPLPMSYKIPYSFFLPCIPVEFRVFCFCAGHPVVLFFIPCLSRSDSPYFSYSCRAVRFASMSLNAVFSIKQNLIRFLKGQVFIPLHFTYILRLSSAFLRIAPFLLYQVSVFIYLFLACLVRRSSLF